MQTKTFAFRLAEKKPKNNRWKARDGVSIAGCTPVGEYEYWSGAAWCGHDCVYLC